MAPLQVCVLLLLTLPFVFGLAILVAPRGFRFPFTLFSVLTLAGLSIGAFLFGGDGIHESLPPVFSGVFVTADFALLGLFAWIGIRARSRRILWLALAQAGLLLGLTLAHPALTDAPDLNIDRLTLLMYLLINLVGGVVAFFALQYIEDENFTERRRSLFIALLVIFLGVMNFLVSSNQLEWFFLAFEATTLASFVLIGFRQDEISRRNAQQALWLNQLGGLSILVALQLLAAHQQSGHFTTLSGTNGLLPLLPIAFLALAAMIKGAQLPFSSWLLGAMVAPTPVSAILHSSTMVKIAPYLILRLAPVIRGTWLSFIIILLTGAIYVSAAVMALDENHFKRVLAWSTVSLLALMMMTAAIGTPQAMTAAIALMLFHGVSKALLFLQAGVMEKVFHKKNVDDFVQLIRYAPLTTFFINVGFLSIALPPFGAFIGKWLGLATASHGMGLVQLILPILFMSFGSVVLSILYFRVVGILAMKKDAHYRAEGGRSLQFEKLPRIYLLSGLGLWGVLALAALLIAPILAQTLAPAADQLLGISPSVAWIWSHQLSIVLEYTTIHFWQIVLAFLFVITVPVLSYLVLLKKVDIVKEYACGENIVSDFTMYSYVRDRGVQKLHNTLMFVLLFLMILAGALGR